MKLDTSINCEFDHVTVEFDYQPSERQEAYYPGCDASVDVTKVIDNWTGNELDFDDFTEAERDCVEVRCLETAIDNTNYRGE